MTSQAYYIHTYIFIPINPVSAVNCIWIWNMSIILDNTRYIEYTFTITTQVTYETKHTNYSHRAKPMYYSRLSLNSRDTCRAYSSVNSAISV
jgi:hypothetical protein